MQGLFLLFYLLFISNESYKSNKQFEEIVIDKLNNNKSDCFSTERITYEDSVFLVTLIKKNGFNYVFNKVSECQIYRTVNKCQENQHNVILTQLYLTFSDSEDVKKIEKKFLENNIIFLRQKVWNRIFMETHGNKVVLTILEDYNYISSWKELLTNIY